MRIRSEDVARAAGVSRPAVSQILNGRGRFSAETIERVHRAAAEMGYRPSAAARSLATGSSDLVVALIPDTTFGTNLQDLSEALTADLARVGLALVLRFPSSPTDAFEHFIKTVRPRAVLASFAPVPAEVRRVLREAAVPLVGGEEQGVLQEVNLQIGRMQGSHLIDSGCSRLFYAHLQDRRQDIFGDAREAGVADAAAAAGLAPPRPLRLGLDEAEAVAALGEVPPERVGIACYNDDVAIALLAACRVLGRRIPEDVALIGMDALPVSSLVQPRLTTISLDAGWLIAAIRTVVLDALIGEPSGELGGELDLRLIPGGTTG